MLWNAKEWTVPIRETKMDAIVFGRGERALILLPGLNVKSVRGTALPVAAMYRRFARDYRVYVFDRIRDVPQGYSIWDMARDTISAMDALGVEVADVIGVSQGGMIAQAMALLFPARVRSLILGVTAARPSDTTRRVIRRWIECARIGDASSIVGDSMTLYYSEAYLKRYGLFLPLARRFVKLKDPERFARLAESILSFDGYDRLDEIKAPTLVVAAGRDQIITGEASMEIAEKLGCSLIFYETLGHGAMEEAADVNERMLEFLAPKH